jgi:prepilin-type N-terminal cleavage/methylation domain-containing protein
MTVGLRSSSAAARGERGFTIIELLVVILIIGVLAAIAIPAFLSQQAKAHDASAKSDARNLVTQIASCYVTTDDYSQCQTQAELPDDTTPWGTASGDAEVMYQPFGVPGTLALAYSTNGDVYGILILPNGQLERVCQTTSGQYPSGGCIPGGPFSSNGYGTW